jgi:type VI secretion system protein VasG
LSAVSTDSDPELVKKMREWQKRFFAGERTPEVVGAVVDRCHEVDSGARIIDRVLSGSMLPELSTRLLARMAEGEPVETIEVGWDEAAGEFTYDIG